MLGLRATTVQLVAHHPTWLEEGRRINAWIAKITGLPLARIQHVGSTAVPNLIAKPILDLDLGLVPAEDSNEFVTALVEAGFIDRGRGAAGLVRLLVWESDLRICSIHLHIMKHASIRWECDIAFRDALQIDPVLRESYSKLKVKLAERFPSNRKAYREGKATFIRNNLYRLNPTAWTKDDEV